MSIKIVKVTAKIEASIASEDSWNNEVKQLRECPTSTLKPPCTALDEIVNALIDKPFSSGCYKLSHPSRKPIMVEIIKNYNGGYTFILYNPTKIVGTKIDFNCYVQHIGSIDGFVKTIRRDPLPRTNILSGNYYGLDFSKASTLEYLNKNSSSRVAAKNLIKNSLSMNPIDIHKSVAAIPDNTSELIPEPIIASTTHEETMNNFIKNIDKFKETFGFIPDEYVIASLSNLAIKMDLVNAIKNITTKELHTVSIALGMELKSADVVAAYLQRVRRVILLG